MDQSTVMRFDEIFSPERMEKRYQYFSLKFRFSEKPKKFHESSYFDIYSWNAKTSGIFVVFS
jgi:hypothetical protein